uniref:Gustatory receptor n=1 Tax=Anopheles farauti TaxID=69004 RepID=A0A182Q2D1_9DIPT
MGQRISSWFCDEPQHVFDVLKYSEKVCSILGVSIYESVSGPASGEVKLSPAKFANFLAMNLLLMVVVLIHASIPYELMNNGSIMVTYGIRTLLVGGVLGISGITILYAWNWKSIGLLPHEIHQLDLKFQLMKHPIDFPAQKRVVLRWYGTFLAVHILIVLGFNLSTLKLISDRFVSWRMVFGQIYFNLVYFAIASQLVSLSYVVSRRFVHLNHALRLRFDTTNGERLRSLLDDSKFRRGTVRERVRIVQKLAGMYHLLDGLAERMNREFGDIYLANIMATLQFSAFNVFALLKVYDSDDDRTRMFTTLNLCGSLYYTLMFMLLVRLSRTIRLECYHSNGKKNKPPMKWFAASSVFDSIRPIYRTGKLIGIFTQTIDFRKRELSKTALDQALLVLAVMIDVYGFKLSLKSLVILSDSILYNVGIYSTVNLGFIISMSMPLCNRLFGGRIFGIFATLHQVDEMLLRYGYRMNHQLNHLYACCFMMTPIVINFVMMFTTFGLGQNSVSLNLTAMEVVTFLRSSLVFTIFGSYTCASLGSIYQRFRGLNKVIG